MWHHLHESDLLFSVQLWSVPEAVWLHARPSRLEARIILEGSKIQSVGGGSGISEAPVTASWASRYLTLVVFSGRHP